jgi:hypothetical protein
MAKTRPGRPAPLPTSMTFNEPLLVDAKLWVVYASSIIGISESESAMCRFIIALLSVTAVRFIL